MLICRNDSFASSSLKKLGGKLTAFVKRNEGTVEDAQYAASQEWASIAAPNGKGITGGRISDGSQSYYESATNSANSKSTQKLREILIEIHRIGYQHE